jgi:hypothetical protein
VGDRGYRRRFHSPSRGDLLSVGVIVVAAGLLAWVVTMHHGSSSVAAKPVPSMPAGSTVTLRGGVTTTTDVGLSMQQFVPGQCVTWNQTTVVNGVRPTLVVPCSHLHLIEISSGSLPITGLGSSFPGYAALNEYARKVCVQPDKDYLGYTLDPYGRFVGAGLVPTSGDWAQGDYTVWCDIQLTLATANGPLTAFTGEVRGANQTLLEPVGSCENALSSIPVPCTEPHIQQVTGNVDLTGKVLTMPKTTAQWQSILSPSCGQLALSFLGGSYPSGVQAGWYTIAPSSWTAGERIVQCTVGQIGAGGAWATITRSLKGAAR